MQGAGAERRGTEFVATPGVQIELDRIAVPDLVVGPDVDRLLIQATKADVEIFLVPQEEELSA